MNADAFMGPLASKAALESFLERRALAEKAGIKVLVAGETLGGVRL